jgi:hypothetical protein
VIEFRCEVCQAKPGEPCRNTVKPGEPLPGRVEHHARVLAPKRKERKR